MSDSGPNLGVRGAGLVFVLAGLFLISTGNRVRKGTSRLPVPAAMAMYGFGALLLGGAGLLVLGAVLLGVTG
jgi:hypothetical protein